MKKYSLLILVLLVSNLLLAQVKFLENTASPGKGNISQISWLQGLWQGEGLGGECEEVWMPMKDNQMVGTFRFYSEGKLVFSEFMRLVQEGDTFVLKIKHFNPDGSPWEEKNDWVDFRLIDIQQNLVHFHGFTIIRNGDSLKMYMSMTENGETSIEELNFKKETL